MTTDKDRLIAEKVMGWEKGFYGDEFIANGLAIIKDWHPSTSIEQAFQVIDKMIADGWKVSITSDGDDKLHWEVVFERGKHVEAVYLNGTLSQAIVDSALKAMEAGK